MSLDTIKRWFEQYDKWVHQAERAERLGLLWSQEDKILGKTYYSLTDLDLEAENIKMLYKQELENRKQRAIEWRKSQRLDV
jgi:hypothetical protein